MSLGNNLFNARKKSGLSQEEAAGKLGVSRQTISKWELDETLPDICQSKKLANMYGLSLDELIEFDIDVKEIQEIIDRTDAGGGFCRYGGGPGRYGQNGSGNRSKKVK